MTSSDVSWSITRCPKCNRVAEWDPEEIPEYLCRYCRRRFDTPPDPPPKAA